MEELNNIADIFIRLGNELKTIAEESQIKNNSDEKETLLTKQEVLDKYKCFNTSSLYSALQNGLPSYKVGKHRYYKSADIDNWISTKSVVSHKSFVKF